MAEDRTFPGATRSHPHPVPLAPGCRAGAGGGGGDGRGGQGGGLGSGAVAVPGLGSVIRADVGAGPATAPGDRRGSSTAVSSEVKVRAWRARRVHTNTHTRARRPLIAHYPPGPKNARSHATTPSAPAPKPPQHARHRPRGPAAP